MSVATWAVGSQGVHGALTIRSALHLHQPLHRQVSLVARAPGEAPHGDGWALRRSRSSWPSLLGYVAVHAAIGLLFVLSNFLRIGAGFVSPRRLIDLRLTPATQSHYLCDDGKRGCRADSSAAGAGSPLRSHRRCRCLCRFDVRNVWRPRAPRPPRTAAAQGWGRDVMTLSGTRDGAATPSVRAVWKFALRYADQPH